MRTSPSRKTQPKTVIEAVQISQWHAWLAHPITKLFFAQLRQDQNDKLLAAAISALQTGVSNAKEHNRLVLAAGIEQIINKYERGTQYPFSPTVPVPLRPEATSGPTDTIGTD